MWIRTSYLLFVDESGTHDMVNVDPKFPLFVLLGLLVGETYYAKTLSRRVREFKRDHLGTPDAVLHSADIRRCEGPFQFLRSDAKRKQAFYDGLNELFHEARLRIFAVAINKPGLKRRYLMPPNPYNVSLSQLLSVSLGPPRLPGPSRPRIARITAESRGRREDKELQSEYQSLRQHGLHSYGASDVQSRKSSTTQRLLPDRIEFLRKARAIPGLELADLAAYPIARAIMAGNWENPAAQVISRKVRELIVFP